MLKPSHLRFWLSSMPLMSSLLVFGCGRRGRLLGVARVLHSLFPELLCSLSFLGSWQRSVWVGSLPARPQDPSQTPSLHRLVVATRQQQQQLRTTCHILGCSGFWWLHHLLFFFLLCHVKAVLAARSCNDLKMGKAAMLPTEGLVSFGAVAILQSRWRLES